MGPAPPSLRELADQFGVGAQAIAWRIHFMEKKGLVTTEPFKRRTVQVTPLGRAYLGGSHGHGGSKNGSGVVFSEARCTVPSCNAVYFGSKCPFCLLD